ncbi:MAG: hypothetical protein ACJ76H_11985, partial [Bacteriovoracaceae bacterium]
MRKLLGAVLALCSFSAYSVERSIWDIQYLPKAGTVYGQSLISYASGETKQNTTADIYGWRFSQSVGYSFSDNFLLTARIRN